MMEFDHVMLPVVNNVNVISSIRAKAKQHQSFKLFLEERSAKYRDLLLHTELDG